MRPHPCSTISCSLYHNHIRDATLLATLQGKRQYTGGPVQHVAFKNVIPEADLAVRLITNYARLEGAWYRPDEVFTADQHGWPGDWEGRLILALALHQKASGRSPAWLTEILARIPSHLNKRGYFGAVLPDGVNDEQQMAGHSWYLRGLLECRSLGYAKRVDPLLDNVVETLLLPSRGNYARYPLDPATRWDSPHWKLSQLQKKRSTHAETSDCGCAFIMLDGATAYYEHTGDTRMRELILEMIARYRRLDFEGLHVQTHATLSALRGILRMYRLENDPALLALVKTVFALYKRKAWTAAYGNYNWFGLPRWTEPCAIIDSFLLAMQLWQATGEPRWLNDAHHIYYNAMAHAQRATGAFGTDTCVGPAGKLLEPITYEVVWCCTMRGAEGLTSAAAYSFFADRNSISLPFYHTCRARVSVGRGEVALRETSAFPAEGRVRLEVLQSSVKRPVTLRFFVPPGCGPALTITCNGRRVQSRRRAGMVAVECSLRRGTVVDVSFAVKLEQAETIVGEGPQRGMVFRHGPSILGVETDGAIGRRPRAEPEYIGNGRYARTRGKSVLRPLWDITRMTTAQSKLQVIF
ncbi:MAG: hypothetical protein GF331_18625 [Chitinivibrionales bacterium]|nr:hypothetical protein [Chitinivibrionales bacterium]